MAKSPAHKFGQLIGNISEDVIRPFLGEFAQRKNLYLDYQTQKRKVRKGKKVTWEDKYGNSHDLDFVLEQGGTDEIFGTPVAFIEVAWRRYTKHSRNKAQEIQGAILPLAETHWKTTPFLGVLLAGEFTDGSIEQLRSLGFHVLHFSYESFVSAFSKEGINIAFDEETSDIEFKKCVKKIEKLSTSKLSNIKADLVSSNKEQMDIFIESLDCRLDRLVEKVVVLTLYGKVSEFNSIKDALGFIDGHKNDGRDMAFQKFELIIKFSNGDHIEGSFREKEKAKEFLEFVATH